MNFKTWTSKAYFFLMVFSFGIMVRAEAPPIRLNTIGFLPEAPKQASIAKACTEFSLIHQGDGETVFHGFVSEPRENRDTGETLYTADFSAFKETGIFQVDVPGVGRSASFRVGRDVYDDPFYTVTRGMYLWRCGTAVSGNYHGMTYAHDACHLGDAWLDFVAGEHTHKNSTRGWHDAGDYNKYVVNAGVTVGCMFRAWEDFGEALQNIRLDIPESGGAIPDFLAELKWELDWLLTTQAPDGSVYHKVTTRRFGDFIMPEEEKTERYFTPWSSAATADFVAMMAQAARNFREVDADYAERCLEAARKSYQFLVAHPENHRADLSGFSTGGYQTRDNDDRLWAAAEMWETTGTPESLADFETRAREFSSKIDSNWDWGNVKNLGMITYLFSKRSGKDEALQNDIRADLLETADSILKTRDEHGYARPLGSRYYWGSNGGVARQVVVLEAARRISSQEKYHLAGLDALGYLFGRNYYGRSFVTGLGENPPMHPHDRRSGSDDIEAPWPGYLVGGPRRNATDWRDTQEDYTTNEIAINWNGALIYALAAFVDHAGDTE